MERNSGASAAVEGPEGAGPADLALVERIRQGDQGALDVLYGRYSSPVYSLVWKILQNAEEAEDVALDVFWQIWRQADRYDPARGAPPAWIFTLARSRSTGSAPGAAARAGPSPSTTPASTSTPSTRTPLPTRSSPSGRRATPSGKR
jgi:RNA polymerase sigma-70 factor (ECF subfamily)